MNVKAVATALLIATAILSLVVPALPVIGEAIGAQIDQVFPTSLTGVVGQSASVLGSIDTQNGKYEVYFGTILVATGTAQANSINVGFRIPETPAGAYTITLRDTTVNSNATRDFTLNAGYSVNPIVPSSPGQLQEGNSVVLNVTVTGGLPNTAYSANITVTLPAPLSTNYSRLVALPTSSSKGTTTTQLTYPDSAFEPSGSLTLYAGTYKVYFNLTQSLGSSQFSIGFTDLTQYHRGLTAKINATGYQSNETATVTVKNQDSGAVVHTVDITPTSAGAVVAQWTVPSNAAIGSYEVNVTGRNTVKAVPDTQTITIPGYPITVRVIDLASRPVSDIVVEALDTATNKTYGGTSDVDGNASLNLESGRHTLTAFWNGLQVEQTSTTVAGAGEFTLSCELTDLRITVRDRNGLLIPSVNLGISYSYITTKDSQSRTGNALGQTDVSGTFSFNATPPGITYAIQAAVYGVVFNVGNDTVSNLPVKPVSDVSIICPSRTLVFKIVDYYGNAIPNARFSMLEVTAGIFYSATTDSNGVVTVNATFGKYISRVYAGSVLLNETVVEAFTDKQVDVQCVLFNLQVNVQVVDYFGQPISNANVRLVEADGTVQSGKAAADGKALFNGVVGGNVQITAYLSEGDDYYEATNIHVDSPIATQVRMGRYIILGSLVIQTSMFVTLMIILPAIVLFLGFELYRRRKARPRKPVTNIEKAGSK